MKRIFFIATACIFILGSCKNKSASQIESGFVLNGKMDEALPAASIALLSYKQMDSLITDSVIVKNGKFTFKGRVIHPIQANISIRHGETFPEKSWNRDSFSFYLENSDIKITSTDSIKKGDIEGSMLSAQSIALARQINPLRNKIHTLSLGLQGKPQDSAYMATADTIKAAGESAKAIVRKFIEEHRDSYIALRDFANYELGYNFDPMVAEAEYNKFSEPVRNTPLANKIWEKIALAKKTSVGQQAIDFSQLTMDGKDFTLSSLRGKYVLVDFWASWCVPCRMENPFVVKAYNQFKDENLEIVGVSLDEKRKNWEYAIEKDGLPWIHVSDLKGWKNEVAKAYGISAVPQNFLLDPNGVIIDKNLRGEEVAARLADIFSQKDSE